MIFCRNNKALRCVCIGCFKVALYIIFILFSVQKHQMQKPIKNIIMNNMKHESVNCYSMKTTYKFKLHDFVTS